MIRHGGHQKDNTQVGQFRLGVCRLQVRSRNEGTTIMSNAHCQCVEEMSHFSKINP